MDSRWILRAYSGFIIAVGLAMTGTSIRGIEGVPLLNQSLLWITGTVLEAAGCAALGLSFTDEPAARRLGLVCFAIGHLLLGVKLQEQWRWSLQQLGVPWSVTVVPLAAGGVLLLTASVSWLHELRGTEAATSRQIRSAYDEHIRHIARREERARLARDLHDAVKQQLFVIQTAAATVQERFDVDAAGARDALIHVRTAAREATTEMEALLDELQAAPMENNGLVESLKKQCEALALRTGADVSFQPGTLPAPGSLPRGAHEAIYRVAQEALANVARHARATRVVASLQTTATHVELRVTDNGSGLTSSGSESGGFERGAFNGHTRSGGMGIANMRTRAAALGGRVSIVAGSPGTDVVLCVPVTSPALRAQRWGITAARWAWAAYGLIVFSNFVFMRIMGDRLSRVDLLLFVGPALAGIWYLAQSALLAYPKAIDTHVIITIAIVDDHRVVSRSLKAYLESFPDLRVVGIARSGEELLEQLVTWRPQVVLQDLLLPGGIDGIETTRRLLAFDPSIRVVALTASFDEARMMGVFRAGAAGYVRKDADPEMLPIAIRAVVAGRTYIDPAIGKRLARQRERDELTPREEQVLRHLALGESNRAISEALRVSDETVKTHVANVLSKLQVDNRAQAAVQALKRGLISSDDLS